MRNYRVWTRYTIEDRMCTVGCPLLVAQCSVIVVHMWLQGLPYTMKVAHQQETRTLPQRRGFICGWGPHITFPLFFLIIGIPHLGQLT